MRFNTYSMQARFFPAIISSIPLMTLFYFLIGDDEVKNLAEFLLSVEFLGKITLAVVLLYFYAHIGRCISKSYERKYFLDSDGFPTTYLMLYSNTLFSDEYKDKYRRLIMKDFNIALKTISEESKDKAEAVRLLNEASK